MERLSVEGLRRIRESATVACSIRGDEEPDTKVVVHMGTCGIASGAKEVMAALREVVDERGLAVRLDEAGCIGICEREPIVSVIRKGEPIVRYAMVSPESVLQIAESHLIGGEVVRELLLSKKPMHGGRRAGTGASGSLAMPAGIPGEPLADLNEVDYFIPQNRITRRNCGAINPYRIDEYIAMDGWSALGKALSDMTPEQVVEEISGSGLRGRGGAGFPTGRKWRFCRDAPGSVKYLICNADEGDPGAFMDRAQLEGDPQSILEGMAIGAYAIGASKGIIYVRMEYPLAVELISHAIDQARAYGLLGENIFGKGFDFDIEVMIGAGAFVCGEETALIHSVQGQRGVPRPRPPFPAASGLYGKPTVINNVETFATVPVILRNGAAWYAAIGSEKSKGTKIFSLAGTIVNNGLVEVEMGTPMEKIIYDIGGGVPEGGTFKAVQCGGPSGGCIPARHLDTPIDYESLTALGAIMGSGGLVVMDDKSCMVDAARFFLEFVQEESCGQCTPGREGTFHMLDILTRITEGKGKEGDIEKLQELGSIIKKTALCGLGQTAPNPVLSTVRHFRDEYEAHIREKRCPALVCRKLVHYAIDPEACNGCMACARACPASCISGEKKEVHAIDPSCCIHCGTCYDVCRFDAVLRT